MSSFFLAMAQRISVVQAMTKNTAPGTLAKLCFGLSERYSDINQQLLALDKKTYNMLVEKFADEPPMMAVACYSLGLKYMGEAARAKQSAGEAVAYLNFATDNMQKITYTTAMSRLYKTKMEWARHVLDEQFKEYRTDNESIYFDGVPTRDRLEIAPGKFIIKPEDFSLDEQEAISFASIEPDQAPPPTSPQRKSGGI